MMNPILNIAGPVLLALAVLHTFASKVFEQLSEKYPPGSVKRNIFHYLGEVEVIFGLWAGVALFVYLLVDPHHFATYNSGHKLIGGVLHFLESQNYTEAAFVFVIMCISSTKPVIYLAQKIIKFISDILPFPKSLSFYFVTLSLGPLLGSFITEPAAMTVTAIILLENFYKKDLSNKFKYSTLGLLFVNVSIGGTLTHFAAPPVLMVASKWNWDLFYMFSHFGHKAAWAILFNVSCITFFNRKEVVKLSLDQESPIQKENNSVPMPIIIIHIVFLTLVIFTAHHPIFFLGLFLFFLGMVSITKKYQSELKLKESLLVGFFLAGLITLGSLQEWWLQKIISNLGHFTLYFGATALTGITDNAALTYLGSLGELSEEAKYYLVAGAVTGGGLTVMANAPNPAGLGILKGAFGKKGVSPLWLFLAALFPTITTLLAFYLIPTLKM